MLRAKKAVRFLSSGLLLLVIFDVMSLIIYNKRYKIKLGRLVCIVLLADILS